MTARLLRDWTDANGRPQRVADDVLAAIEERLSPGTPAESPFLSVDAGHMLALPGGAAGTAELLFEDGGRTHVAIADDGTILAPDRPGYHQLCATGCTFTLAIAPRRCPAPPARAWGAAVQIPALREATPTAFGDAGTLARATPAFARIGAQALAISPTHALFPGAPARISPYSPSTRLFHNVLLADPSLIGLAPPPAAAPPLIEWQAAIPERMALLRAAYDGAGEAVRAAAAAWRRQRGAMLEAHARFDALHARLGGDGWRDWPAAFHDPAGEAVIRFAAQEEDAVAFFAFLQWLTDLSLAQAQRTAREGMAIGLIADVAVGMASDGSHAWGAPDEVLCGLTIGAPPDPLGPQGQNWGITALDPLALERHAFRPFIDTLRAAFAHAGGVRIDHALGLERLWVIPEGADASQGAYLTMPGEHLRRIVAIEAHRAGGIVIAEDLGTVPPGLRDALAQRCMMGMRVLPFERDGDGGFLPPAEWDDSAVAMTGTHDTPTVAGWWTGHDLDWARRLGRGGEDDRATARAALWQALGGTGDPPADVPLDAILAHVAAAPGALALFPLEDLLGLLEQPNLPGTIDEHPNWRRRLSGDIHTLLAQRAVVRRARLLTSERPG
ncbi:MAG: 4-alpha-glucanotransferase [Sphingomonas adhaesiva]|uniref:4-alpha-glucanotransferase n=1 Tax=Sphingomonas adhaesiva TaxID=28212 RepID=UPI002FF8F020